VLDIAEIARRAHRQGVKVAVDSTFASPALQRPIEFGADIVLHSLTKYINGHGDLLGGALLADAATVSRLKGEGLRYITGATLSPFAAAMVLRGLKTLDLRMERHSANALAVAEYLDAHSKVAWVSYPFLNGYPESALARAQMSAGSGMIAFGLHGGFEGARRLIDGLRLFARAVSLGDAESLVTHPASLRRARPHGAAADDVRAFGEDDLVRLSVGLENVRDLIDDLDRALAAC
jgi:methionine-gamma-lyase